MAALEENIFTMERGTRADGKPVGFRMFSRRRRGHPGSRRRAESPHRSSDRLMLA